MSRRSRFVWVVVCFLVAIPAAYEGITRIKWVGKYSATLRIDSDRRSPVRQVTWDTGFRAEEIRQAVAQYQAGAAEPAWDFRHAPVRVPDDGILKIEGRSYGTESPFRIACDGRVVERFVILKVEFEDGTTTYDWVEVTPADRRSVTVVHISGNKPGH
ncbi:MAG TPA: hypothetical protein VM597_14350 [Gemmataceae bacterium]|nr:hypothetical protein [Gemmataceae bacterium]